MYESFRQDGDKFGLAVPDVDVFLNIVPQYKHLGGMIDARVSNMPRVLKRCQHAMDAYVPLARKLYGEELLGYLLRWSLANSLIFSRLFFNAHVRAFKTNELGKMHATYMRVVRRVSSNVRYDSTACSDYTARSSINAPSIECILTQKSLLYASRLATSKCSSLLSLLSFVFCDLAVLYDSLGGFASAHARRDRSGSY